MFGQFSPLIFGLIIILVLFILFKILKFSLKTLIKLIINIVVGIIVIYLLNLIPGVEIPLEWWSGLIVGIFGIPGVIIMLIISFII